MWKADFSKNTTKTKKTTTNKQTKKDQMSERFLAKRCKHKTHRASFVKSKKKKQLKA